MTLKIPRIGDVVRCKRCQLCVEVDETRRCPCGECGAVFVIGTPVSSEMIADQAVEFCAHCHNQDDIIGTQLHQQAVATNTECN